MIEFATATADEVEVLIAKELLSTRYPWTVQNLMDSIKASDECRIVKQEQLDIGYYVVKRVLDEAELLNIVIFKPFQLKGYGGHVLTMLKQGLHDSGIEALYLEVRQSNQAARNLYQRQGFKLLSTRRNYYRRTGESEDALVMRCSL